MIKKDIYGSLSMPVYNTVAYEFETAEAMEEAFCGLTTDHTYSRITNPTVEYFEQKIKQITNAHSVTALSSGMAAISNTFFTIARSGCNIVTSPHLFGNTFSFFKKTLQGLGIEVRFCDLTNPDDVRKYVDNNTCAIYLEIITNPQLEVADLRQLSTIANEWNIPLIGDTTIVPPHLFHAREAGIDIEIISTTKYISGGATSLGGLIIDYGKFNEFTPRLRKEIHRNLGAYMTPQVAYMQSIGLETMEVRYSRQAASCLELAKRLKEISQIESVNYPGLPDSPFYSISQKLFGDLPGAMFTFDLSGREECFTFLNRLKLIKRATNLFDNKTLAIHPASTIYGTFSDKEREDMDISQKTIRISVGLENVDELFMDIMQGIG